MSSIKNTWVSSLRACSARLFPYYNYYEQEQDTYDGCSDHSLLVHPVKRWYLENSGVE